MAKKNKDKDSEGQPKKKKSKIRTLFKWTRRISFIAGIVGAIRKYQVEQNEQKQPPAV